MALSSFSKLLLLPLLSLLVAAHYSSCQSTFFCPTAYISQTPLTLPYQPGYLSIVRGPSGSRCNHLGITSFFNVPRFSQFPETFYPDVVSTVPLPLVFNATPQELTIGNDNLVWPSNAVSTPRGFVPFKGIAVPQGFVRPDKPGRLSIFNTDTKEEYIVFQSTQSNPPVFTFFGDPANSPRFFTNVSFEIDCNGDGLKDIVTAASGIRGIPQFNPSADPQFSFAFYPPSGELWCLINPGSAISKTVEWERKLLYGGVNTGFVGPDLNFQAVDIDKDGTCEIVATHTFFDKPKLSIYAPQPGMTWADVDATDPTKLPRVKDIETDAGSPYNVEVVDLNLDNQLDILASFNAPDNCTEKANQAGSVRAYEYTTADIFLGTWTERILFDGIFGAPNLPRAQLPGNQAPGQAKTFRKDLTKPWEKPWILLCGQDSGRVWILRPASFSKSIWDYSRALVFDIDAVYGAGTTSNPDKSGVLSVSIGSPAITYGESGYFWNQPFLYIPIYQKRSIYVISFVPTKQANKPLNCAAETARVCLPDTGVQP